MRNSKTVQLARGLSVTVHEFTVAEVVSFLTALGTVVYSDAEIEKYIAENSVDMLKRAESIVHFQQLLGRMSPFKWLLKINLEQVLALVMEVNKAYFVGGESKRFPDPKRLKPKTATAIAKGLCDSVEVLIREGHSEPFAYGLAFFVSACEFQENRLKGNK